MPRCPARSPEAAASLQDRCIAGGPICRRKEIRHPGDLQWLQRAGRDQKELSPPSVERPSQPTDQGIHYRPLHLRIRDIPRPVVQRHPDHTTALRPATNHPPGVAPTPRKPTRTRRKAQDIGDRDRCHQTWIGLNPATPIATSVSPRRNGRPKVSVITTAASTPNRCISRARSRRAERSGVRWWIPVPPTPLWDGKPESIWPPVFAEPGSGQSVSSD